MSGPPILKTVIFLGYECNNRCSFCVSAHKRSLAGQRTRRVAARLERAAAEGSRYVEFIGGETTIRDDIVVLVRLARALGFSTIAMASNGRMYAYDQFARRIVAAGLTDLILSIHGPDAATHDGLTGAPGSFAQLRRGLENMRALGFSRIGSNTTIVRPNLVRLEETGRLILELGIRNSEFIFVDPNQGGAYARFEELVPTISEAAPIMRRLLDLGRARSPHWCVRYVPLCHFIGYEEHVSERLERRLFRTRHFAPEFANADVEGSRRVAGRVRPARCLGCRLYEDCEGLFSEYHRRRGDAELKPV